MLIHAVVECRQLNEESVFLYTERQKSFLNKQRQNGGE